MAEKEEEEEEEADWSNLPFDLMEEILKELEYTSDISDYARFATVCVSWQQAYNLVVTVIHRQLPVLIIPTSSTTTLFSSDQEDEFHSFYRITDGKVYDSFKFRMPSYMCCHGSSLGWLITVDSRDLSVRLFNPFLSLSANNEILLPSLNHFPSEPDPNYGLTKSYLVKAVLSADPLSNPDNYIVMAMYGWSRLAFFRPGDKAWTPIGPNRLFADVIYYSGREFIYEDGFFHAVAVDGTLTANFKVADILAKNVEGILATNKRQYMGHLVRFHKIPSSLPGNIYKWLYLVQALKTLYLVQRMVDVCHDEGIYSTIGFKIFKLDKFEQEEKTAAAGEVEEQVGPRPKFGWTEVNNLCGRTVFIGCSTSMSILSYGCKPDCIYYTDDYCHGWRIYPNSVPHDMGVFNIVDKSIEQHYRPIDPSTPLRPVPIWIEPSLQKTGGSTYKLMLTY